MINNTLLKVFGAMVLAVIIGLLTGPDASLFGVTALQFYNLIGQLFLNALTLVVVPLVAASIITGTARMGQEQSFGALGIRTFGLYLSTTATAVLIGWAMAVLIAPGTHQTVGMELEKALNTTAQVQILPSPAENNAFTGIENVLFKLIPSNILAAASQGQMLGLIFFCLVFGYFITQIEPQAGSVLLNFWRGLFQVMMKMTYLVMKALPVGVFGLVAKVVATTGLSAIEPIGWFFFTVIAAFVVYALIALPLMLKFIGQLSPMRHFKAMSSAIFTAFSTSSSAATLPITIECVEKRAGVSNRICSFTVPLGSSLNLSGTALYTCVSVFFICQAYGVDMSFSMQFLIALISLLTSIGMAGIPSASLAAIIVILQTIGVPAEGVVLIFAVERLLDMIRTSINVWGNSCCAVMVAKFEGENNVLAN